MRAQGEVLLFGVAHNRLVEDYHHVEIRSYGGVEQLSRESMNDIAVPETRIKMFNIDQIRPGNGSTTSTSHVQSPLLRGEASERSLENAASADTLKRSRSEVDCIHQMQILRQNSLQARIHKQRDPGKKFTIIADWPHLTTRGWYICKLCKVYECQRTEFQRHLLSEDHKFHRRKEETCGVDVPEAYFTLGEG
ncbi:hypothetical protein TcWFU_004276 [Taenia crassiceps]|uniref:Matrin-type domain-containing protein n=1 Tax=Taenia crassiceps TaxID=6207 RepID=A0ABR4QGT7_9CEST